MMGTRVFMALLAALSLGLVACNGDKQDNSCYANAEMTSILTEEREVSSSQTAGSLNLTSTDKVLYEQAEATLFASADWKDCEDACWE